jgi:hypothetical protein
MYQKLSEGDLKGKHAGKKKAISKVSRAGKSDTSKKKNEDKQQKKNKKE